MNHNDISKALGDIKSFFLEAGDLAVRNQPSAKVSYKAGNQALTETDVTISEMAQSRLSHWTQKPGHILLDEEKIHLAGSPTDVFQNSEYQWALDPIDGTAGYALGRKMWGISLGILHNGTPIAGGIYLPVFQEMLLADNKKAWQIKHAGTPHEIQSDLTAKDMEVHSQIFVESGFGSNMTWGANWDDNKIWVHTPESAVQGFFSALVGQAAGMVATKGFCIWDVVGSMAVAIRAGYKIRTMKDGRAFQRFAASDFQQGWKLADHWLLSAEKNFNYINQALRETR